MNTNYDARGHLERMGIPHDDLDQADVITISYTLHGWHLVPRTPAGPRPIKARAWLLAALHTGGRYAAPDTPGHPADLEDGARHVDSVILMAVIQRHFLTVRQPAWEGRRPRCSARSRLFRCGPGPGRPRAHRPDAALPAPGPARR